MIGDRIGTVLGPGAQIPMATTQRFGDLVQGGMNQLPGIDSGAPGLRAPAGPRATPGSPANASAMRSQLAQLLGNF